MIYSTPEELYRGSVPLHHRRKLGQFFTSPAVSDLMAGWVGENRQADSILDPAVGLGIFFRSLAALHPERRYSFVGYELDPGMIQRSQETFRELPGEIAIRGEDFLTADWDASYDGILCNPPYLKFKDYEPKDELLGLFESKLRMKLSGFSNLYILFLLKALHQLAAGGRAAFIVPSEFMNADYGVMVKEYMLRCGMLRYVIIVDSHTGLFEDAITTSSILLFANDAHRDTVHFINIEQKEDFLRLPDALRQYPSASPAGAAAMNIRELDPGKKWRAYYQGENSGNYRRLAPFSKYANVSRGIATGANEYFAFTESRRTECRIRNEFLLPCVTKSAQVKDAFFTREHYEALQAADKPVRILNVKPDDLRNDPDLRDYIERGEALHYHGRFLTRKRNPWYLTERRSPAPIWVSTFHRDGSLRFIRNEAGIHHLTPFHSVYIHEERYVDLIMAYLLTDISNDIFQDSRREYGRGLRKFEPNDIRSAYIADVETIEETVQREILKNYSLYRRSRLLRDEDGSVYLKRINELFRGLMTPQPPAGDD